MRQFLAWAIMLLGLAAAGCQGQIQAPAPEPAPPTPEIETAEPAKTTLPPEAPAPEEAETTEEDTTMKLSLTIGEQNFQATLADTEAAAAFAQRLQQGPLDIDLRDYSGFEKVGALGFDLPADDRQTTTQPGDIVLYSGDQIVLFYGSNSWSYTRLGALDDLSGWEEALGSGAVTVRFSLE